MGNTVTFMASCTALHDTPADPINPYKIDLTHYEQLKILGKGGQGTVSVCRNRVNNDIVAVKCISKHALLKHTTFLYTLFNERNLLILNAQCQYDVAHRQPESYINPHDNTMTHHPSFLCSVHCTFQSPTHLYMVLPYLSGGDMRYHLTDKSMFTETVAQFYAAELLVALHDLHERNILYRDVKPENILLDRRGHTVLCDFGLAGELKKSSDYTTYGRSGTTSYFSPELICDIPYSFEVDYWCYGVLLYELIHGRRPIRIGTINALMNSNKFKLIELYNDTDGTDSLRKDLVANIHYRSGLSQDVLDLLKGLMTVDRTKRYGCGNDSAYYNGWRSLMQHPWFRPVDWAQIRSRSVKPPIRPRRGIINANMKFELEYQLIDNITEERPISENKQKYFHKWDWNNTVVAHSTDDMTVDATIAAQPTSSTDARGVRDSEDTSNTHRLTTKQSASSQVHSKKVSPLLPHRSSGLLTQNNVLLNNLTGGGSQSDKNKHVNRPSEELRRSHSSTPVSSAKRGHNRVAPSLSDIITKPAATVRVEQVKLSRVDSTSYTGTTVVA